MTRSHTASKLHSFIAFAALLLCSSAALSCASSEPVPAAVPEWDAIPAGIPAALCVRLQMDGIGMTGAEVSIVKVTQPLATPQALAHLGKPRRNRVVTIVHRALPVVTISGGAGGCTWKPVDAIDPNRQFDRMVVELSAPVANPAKLGAGIVARVSLGGTHPNWYWIDLIPRSGGGWAVGRIFPIPL